jgi:enoyl-CoA hydratase/carnithine racemase
VTNGYSTLDWAVEDGILTLTRSTSSSASTRRSVPSLDDLRDRFDDRAVVAGARDTGGRLALAISRCSQPVIGALNGPAVGKREPDLAGRTTDMPPFYPWQD